VVITKLRLPQTPGLFYATAECLANDRPGPLARCIASLEAGHVLLVTKLDRLARSTRDLLNTLAAISDAGASFKSLGDPWCGRPLLTEN
jgi:DNA invertase Pin-like site-specific DNA recombinase